jgi:hypothetical protein
VDVSAVLHDAAAEEEYEDEVKNAAAAVEARKLGSPDPSAA